MKNVLLSKSMIKEVVSFDHNQKDFKIMSKLHQGLGNVCLHSNLDHSEMN